MTAAQITESDAPVVFQRPGLGWFVVLDGGLIKLGVLSFNRAWYEKVRGIVPLPEQDQLRVLFGGAVALHVGEAMVARRMARRRGVPSGRWVRQTLLVGFPSLLKLRAIAPVDGSPVTGG